MQNVLNDLIVYRSNVQTIHWKMKGQGFLSLHKLTDKIYSQVDEFIDLVAEKFIQKEIEVKTTLNNAIKNSSLIEADKQTYSIEESIDILASQAQEILSKAEQANLPDKLGAMYVIVDELRDYFEKTIWLLQKSK